MAWSCRDGTRDGRNHTALHNRRLTNFSVTTVGSRVAMSAIFVNCSL